MQRSSNPNARVINIEGVSSLLEVGGLDHNPEVAAELKKTYNYDVKRPPAAVPMETGLAILQYAAHYLYPDLPKAAALRKLGRLGFEKYRQSIIGRIMLAAMPLWGPHRLLKNSPRLYEMTVKYGVRTVKQVGPCRYEFRHTEDPGHIEILAGVAEASLEAAGAKNVKVTIRTLSTDDHILNIEWDE